MKRIKILFLLTGLSISTMGFGMETTPDLRLVEAILEIEDLAFDGTPKQQENNIEEIKKLINAGVDVNHAKNGITPLLFTSVIGPLEIVKLLLAKGAKVNEVDNEGRTPLILASIFGRPEVVKLLLENGADVNQCDDFDGRVRRPLDVAATREIQMILAKWPLQVEQAKKLGRQVTTADPLPKDTIAEMIQTLPAEPDDNALCSIQ